jgi:hypothetical protein
LPPLRGLRPNQDRLFAVEASRRWAIDAVNAERLGDVSLSMIASAA